MEVFLIVSSEGVSVNKPISGNFYHSMSLGNALPWREEGKGEKRNKLSIKKKSFRTVRTRLTSLLFHRTDLTNKTNK